MSAPTPRTAPGPLTRIARRLAFAAVVLVLLAAAGEGAARLTTTHRDTVFSPQTANMIDHPTRLFMLKPGHREGGPQPFSVNEEGFRGPPLRATTPEGRRILLLGESSTMGMGVGDDDVYARVLERELAAAGHPEWEVVNAGTGAWTVWQSAVLLAEEIARLDPDVVIPYHQANDSLPTGVVDDRSFMYEVTGTDRELYLRRRPIAPLLALAYHSRAYLLLRKAVLQGRASELPSARDIHDTTGGTRVPIEDRREAWDWMARTCAEHGATLIATVPTYREPDRNDRVIQDAAAAHQLLLVDLEAARQAAGLDDDAFFMDAVHPNVAGHRFIARQLRDAVLPLIDRP